MPEYFDVSVMVVLVIEAISHHVSPAVLRPTKSLAAKEPVMSMLVATDVLPSVNVRVPPSPVGAADLAHRTSSPPLNPVEALLMVLNGLPALPSPVLSFPAA